jgi:hypothetical protein
MNKNKNNKNKNKTLVHTKNIYTIIYNSTTHICQRWRKVKYASTGGIINKLPPINGKGW